MASRHDGEEAVFAVDGELLWDIACNRRHVFPPGLINDLALDLSQRLDCHVPVTECEVSAAQFVAALGKAGWTIRSPAGDAHAN